MVVDKEQQTLMLSETMEVPVVEVVNLMQEPILQVQVQQDKVMMVVLEVIMEALDFLEEEAEELVKLAEQVEVKVQEVMGAQDLYQV